MPHQIFRALNPPIAICGQPLSPFGHAISDLACGRPSRTIGRGNDARRQVATLPTFRGYIRTRRMDFTEFFAPPAKYALKNTGEGGNTERFRYKGMRGMSLMCGTCLAGWHAEEPQIVEGCCQTSTTCAHLGVRLDILVPTSTKGSSLKFTCVPAPARCTDWQATASLCKEAS